MRRFPKPIPTGRVDYLVPYWIRMTAFILCIPPLFLWFCVSDCFKREIWWVMFPPEWNDGCGNPFYLYNLDKLHRMDDIR